MAVINKQRVERCFSSALSQYDQAASVQKAIVQQLMVLLRATQRAEFDNVLEIGCGTGQLTRALAGNYSIKQWDINDLCDVREFIHPLLASQNYRFHQSDAEHFNFPSQYDLIATASTVQWFENIKAFVQCCAQSLKSNGLLLLSTFSPENLHEIKALTNIGLNYPSLNDWQQWLMHDFDILHLEQQHLRLEFDTPQAVLRHLKQSGVTGIKRHIWTKAGLQAFCQNYVKNYRTLNGKVALSYTPILLLAKRK
ncbi:MAG TPA: malonyl-[acyl-carrier protein] O-methyltransferase BioC [Pasteurellaceae bacterium]|nr:malonyl-[acyl-carrier protein] O-methyltransferase BioC [Pasteurellaceae bacterium]